MHCGNVSLFISFTMLIQIHFEPTFSNLKFQVSYFMPIKCTHGCRHAAQIREQKSNRSMDVSKLLSNLQGSTTNLSDFERFFILEPSIASNYQLCAQKAVNAFGTRANWWRLGYGSFKAHRKRFVSSKCTMFHISLPLEQLGISLELTTAAQHKVHNFINKSHAM